MARAAGTVRFRGRTVDIVPSDPQMPRYQVVDAALAARLEKKKAANN
jgi:hypothetical protein